MDELPRELWDVIASYVPPQQLPSWWNLCTYTNTMQYNKIIWKNTLLHNNAITRLQLLWVCVNECARYSFRPLHIIMCISHTTDEYRFDSRHLLEAFVVARRHVGADRHLFNELVDTIMPQRKAIINCQSSAMEFLYDPCNFKPDYQQNHTSSLHTLCVYINRISEGEAVVWHCAAIAKLFYNHINPTIDIRDQLKTLTARGIQLLRRCLRWYHTTSSPSEISQRRIYTLVLDSIRVFADSTRYIGETLSLNEAMIIVEAYWNSPCLVDIEDGSTCVLFLRYLMNLRNFTIETQLIPNSTREVTNPEIVIEAAWKLGYESLVMKWGNMSCRFIVDEYKIQILKTWPNLLLWVLLTKIKRGGPLY